MSNTPLIVLSLEGFTASALGCYGCSWNDTPTIDRLAARGCVWDRFIATSDRPAEVFADWTHRSTAWREAFGPSHDPLVLVTDVSSEGLHDTCFDEVLSLEPDPLSAHSMPADDIVDTCFGRLVAAVTERLSGSQPWSLIWLHSNFLTRCWDAPIDLRLEDEDGFSDELEREPQEGAFAAEEAAGDVASVPAAHFPDSDPDHLWDSTQPPNLEWDDRSHPDLATGWMKRYGCQIRLVDLLLDVLLQTDSVRKAALAIVGTSGFRLGQGGQIGHRRGPMRSPDIRLPLIVNRGGPLHIPHVTSSRSLSPILGQLASGSESICPPSQWCSSLAAIDSVRTDSDRARVAMSDAHWFFVQDADGQEHLYLKPDDVDDFNDVGRLRSDVLETFRTILRSNQGNGDSHRASINKNGPADP